MIILTGFSRSGNKKTLSLSRDRSQVIYQVDGITIDTFSMSDATAVCKELNNLIRVDEYDKYYINKLLSAAEQEGIAFKDIRNFYDALLQPTEMEKQLTLNEQSKDVSTARVSNIQQNKKENEKLIYENKEEMLIDLRRHLDDVYNAYIEDHGIRDSEWFNWNHALYTSANYLETYLSKIPHDSPIVLPCSLVDETCEDTVKRQYEEYLQKDPDLCVKF